MFSPYKTTIANAATSRDLTVLETVKEELAITHSAHDDLLSRFICEQSSAAETYCRRVFALETLVDSFRVDCDYVLKTRPLILSRRPIASITSIVEDGITLAVSDYEFEAEAGLLWRLDSSDDRSAWAAAKIVVTFVAGHELLGELPRDVERAVILLVKQSYFAKTRDPMAKAEEVEGVGRTEFWVGSVPGSGSMPPDVVRYLAPHRDILV